MLRAHLVWDQNVLPLLGFLSHTHLRVWTTHGLASQELGDHASFTLSSLLPLFPTLLLRAAASSHWCRHLLPGALKLFLPLCLFLYSAANSVFKGGKKTRITYHHPSALRTFTAAAATVHSCCCNSAQLLLQRCTAAIPALSRQRLEDCEFKAGLDWGAYSRPVWDSLSHYIQTNEWLNNKMFFASCSGKKKN